MSLFEKYFKACNDLDRAQLESLLHDDYVLERPAKGDKLNKHQVIDLIMSGVREDMTAHNRRLIYENDEVIVSHSILEIPNVSNDATLLVRLVKDGKIIYQISGATPMPASEG
tara:strand:- start:190 stop:528 length:339 start_codon:yes stop_codon:yes gene_type:complete